MAKKKVMKKVVPKVEEPVVEVITEEPKPNFRFKTCHWTMLNGSGMFKMAESLVKAERTIGIDAILGDFAKVDNFEEQIDADVHVIHTHMPDVILPQLTKPLKTVWVAHGSVENVFFSSIEAGHNQGYGAGDSFLLCQHRLQNSDASVTFWPRQRAIWQSLCDKHTKVDYVTMGVETDFWKPVESRGKYMGTPSVFTAENCHPTKSPYDLFIAWPWVYKEIPLAHLHAIYLPNDVHRWFFPLINRNGAAYKTIASSLILPREGLRNAFVSTDFFIGLVRYGEYNRLCLEANASGAVTISYQGNPYSDYWIDEGDQRLIAKDLVAILKGDIEPRKKHPVPDISVTARAMSNIYERVLS